MPFDYNTLKIDMQDMNRWPPRIPTILTVQDWNSKKGKRGRMAGKTGVGEAMRQVKTAYDRVNWSKLNIKELEPRKIQPWGGLGAKTYDVHALERVVKEAKTELNGNVRQLVIRLKTLSGQAAMTAAMYKKSRWVPSSLRKHTEEVAKVADFWSVSLNTFTLGSIMAKQQSKMTGTWEDIRKNIIPRLRKAFPNTPGRIQKMRSIIITAQLNPNDPMFNAPHPTLPRKTWQNICNRIIMDAARDLSQGTTNYIKFTKGGHKLPPIDMKILQPLNDQLVPIANNSQNFPPGTSPAYALAEIAKLEGIYKALIQLFG
jgi:hypothetical protein